MTSGASPHPAIPRSTGELTPEWFSAALSAGGENVVVEAAALERLGGLSSIVVRARLGYAAGSRAGPGSVIVKLPPVPAPKRFGPGFDREVRFYRELAPRMNVAVPRPLWVDLDEETGDSVLVLEDFPGYLARETDGIASVEEAELLVGEIARVHAAWWENEGLGRLGLLRTLPEFIDRVDGRLEAGTPLFLDRFAEAMDAGEVAVFEALPGGFRAAVEPLLAAPKTLVHHDLSLRNVLFAPGRVRPAAVLIDWQLAQWNAGVRDVSFLAGSCVPAERRRHEEPGLLRHYWERLRELGVAGYSFEGLEEGYRRSVICDFGRMVMTAGHDAVEEGMAAAVAHQLACRRGSARELDLLALL